MQDLPGHATEAVGDRPRGLLITQARQQAKETTGKWLPLAVTAACGTSVSTRRIYSLPFRRATAVVLLRAFLLPRAGPHPRSQVPGRGKRARLHVHLGHHLLRRVRSEAGVPPPAVPPPLDAVSRLVAGTASAVPGASPAPSPSKLRGVAPRYTSIGRRPRPPTSWDRSRPRPRRGECATHWPRTDR